MDVRWEGVASAGGHAESGGHVAANAGTVGDGERRSASEIAAGCLSGNGRESVSQRRDRSGA